MRRNKIRFNTSFTAIVLVVVVMIAIFLGMGSTKSPSSKDASAPASIVIKASQTDKVPVHITQSSDDVLKEFFQTHPDEEVRTHLTELIVKGTIMLGWKNLGASAAFTIVQDNQGKLTPVLALTPELFIPKNRARSQLVILHEYEHYKQWRDGTVPESTFLLRRVPEGDSTQLCNEKWHAERLAYHKECEFGHRHGLLDQLDQREGLSYLCRATEQMFEPTLKRLMMLGDPMKGVCSQAWGAI